MTRRNTIRLTAIALALLAALGGGVVLASGRHTPAVQASTSATGQHVPWIVLEAGRHARSLVIQYHSVACPDGLGKARLDETRHQIAIQVTQKKFVTNKPCARMGLIPRLVVRLQHPIAGRRIVGENYPWRLPRGSVDYLSKPQPDPPHPEIELPLVPRVIGLSRSEAISVLDREGFRVSLSGAADGHVIAQAPLRGHLAPGSARHAPYNGRVTLTVGP